MSSRSRKSKDVVEGILSSMTGTFTTEKILKEFRKPKDKIDNKLCMAILKNLVKNNPNAKSSYEETINNFDKHEPYEWLEKFLIGFYKTEVAVKAQGSSNLTNSKNNSNSNIASSEIPQCHVSSLSKDKSDMLSPGFSSTKLCDDIAVAPALNVADIKNRVVQAAIDGVSKYAKSSVSDPQDSPSIFHEKRRKNLWFLDDADLAVVQSTKNICVLASPLIDQEKILMKEILYCLVGVPGNFITAETIDRNGDSLSTVEFHISTKINSSLKDIADNILPLANYYSDVERFIFVVSSTDSGQILQALAATLRTFTNNFYKTLVKLEDEVINLSRLYYCLRPTLKVMALLAEVVDDIVRCGSVGAKVLTILCDKISLSTGDAISQDVLVDLVEAAAVPYFETLERWILKGVIIDPHQEFMIEDNEVAGLTEIDDIYSDQYWSKRYSICRDRCPSFVAAMSEQILRTGKYLNVIRQCNSESNNEHQISKKLRFFALKHRSHQSFIGNAYHFASNKLLSLLVNEKDLNGHLMSIKRYFLLQQGDFINQFMDAAEEELGKNVEKIQPIKLENLLGLTLRTSVAKHDPYKDYLTCYLCTTELTKIMSRIHLAGSNQLEEIENIELVGFECFTFSFEIQWPMSLILPYSIITQYQMLFRLLFQCKHVERRLCSAWLSNKNILKYAPLSGCMFRSTFLLRNSMLHVIQNLENYFMVEVIEPYYGEFSKKMQSVKNVDEVIENHNDFVDKCMVNCMLKTPETLSVIIWLFKLCLKFSAYIEKQKSFKPSAEYFEVINAFDSQFKDSMVELFNKINFESNRYPTHKYMNLIRRINFNTFFNELC
ncbi:Gamma-tubulin complex component 2 like [Pseudolycoriella hygida]|uniref:Gamma-tubulin complex component n=1 Tax=Pseudolycoriella hygida TaxID=35572 RepID=A0A9Q0NDS0_9DIPT|nr:Gamma-tubulin complex component 2 like [Pseudolycoriella hygida]